MYRTHNCGELRIEHVGEKVKLAGWVATNRQMGTIAFIDIRDRYGITQIALDEKSAPELIQSTQNLGREFVLQIEGIVRERYSKNAQLATGNIEVVPEKIVVLNSAKVPPFLIEDETDGGDELRMQFRYLDLRRNTVREKLILRSNMAVAVRNYLHQQDFIEVETPVLIKSTPEGARDFVVPSRMNPGQWYALPQSPQTFKQLLMVSGFDKYFQIVKCFRDEDLRADRQPEFTQIDCEMSFVEREDILNTFEGLTQHLFTTTLHLQLGNFPRITYAEAMQKYGSDKPDIRFGMEFQELTDIAKGKGFGIFDNAECILAICSENTAAYTRKQIDELTEFVKRPQIGAAGLIWCKFEHDGTTKSSVDKFYNPEDLKIWLQRCNAKPGDSLWILAGKANDVRKQMNELRLELGSRLGMRKPTDFKPLWVLDFPLFEYDEAEDRYFAMHHPFTSPLPEDLHLLDTNPGEARANAYDLVINGVEIGGGSIRIHDKQLQKKMFELLGFSDEEAQSQFGFLMNAFEYGAPPHGGIAFGFDRLCSLFGGSETIRDYIAFPKNNAGRDTMIDAPSAINPVQLKELGL